TGGRGSRSGAEAPVARAEGAERAEEVHSAEGRPEDLAEVELRMRALPEQEAGEALLSRGPDEQVRVGLAARVEMLADVLQVEALGELLDRGALGGLLGEEGAHRISDLTPPPIPDRNVHNQARFAGCGRARLFH